MSINIFKIFSIFFTLRKVCTVVGQAKNRKKKKEENECTKCVDTIPNTLLPWNKKRKKKKL